MKDKSVGGPTQLREGGMRVELMRRKLQRMDEREVQADEITFRIGSLYCSVCVILFLETYP